jgi:hypothetical protein
VLTLQVLDFSILEGDMSRDKSGRVIEEREELFARLQSRSATHWGL